ncbi:uncharacterized protein DMAD_03932 [Drosophila madeirensis]|uniref:Translation initiation factor IF-3, mitochondrial n=1 Tax=Drosophila madeirensis TaxID=30013 RepID=A0AAU9GAI7_DROMD
MHMQRFQFMMRSMLRVQQVASMAQHQQQLRNLSLYWHLAQSQRAAGAPGNKSGGDQKPKNPPQRITLVQQNQAVSITTLEEAQKLAKRRELHLLRLEQTDTKTGRAMFKLVTSAEMLADDVVTTTTTTDKFHKKSEKSLTIGARITEHDLSSRLKNIVKWLSKRHEVRILIQGSASGSDESSAERIVKAIGQTITEPQVIGKIVQKRSKGSYIKFNILPVTQPASSTPTAAQS